MFYVFSKAFVSSLCIYVCRRFMNVTPKMQPSFFQIHGVQETVGGVFQAEERGAGVT